MAESRVEKFREYRKSIISDGSPSSKVTIDTTLNVVESNNSEIDYTEELEMYKKVQIKNVLGYVLFGVILVTIMSLLIVFGIRVF